MKKIAKQILGPLFSPGSFLYSSYHLCRGVLAACLAGFPSEKMVVIGVTGTNGKTTTANLIAQILEQAGYKVGLSTTVNFWVGGQKTTNETKMTTDNPFALQKRLRRMAQAGTQYAVIETASHALSQHRTIGINYDVAVFTNLTWDHLDYHKTFESYRDAKLKLFRQTYLGKPKLNQPKLAVINLDDDSSKYFSAAFPGSKYFFSLEKSDGSTTKESQLSAKVISATASNTVFELSSPAGRVTIDMPLVGNFNLQNALAAASTCFALGLSVEQIQQGLSHASPIPGRLELIGEVNGAKVIVDYAHNPDGFKQVLTTLKQLTPGRLITVFGAAGERDRQKRPMLGEVASAHSDILVLTEEDPASEDPMKIIDAIRQGIGKGFIEGTNLYIVMPRSEALKKAMSLAQPGDTIVALAMGAQTVMATAQGLVNYNEREVIKNLIGSSTHTSNQ